jgi:hypothetical protein
MINAKILIMKHFILICGIVLLSFLCISAFRNIEQTSITGRVNPVDGATSALAISGRDSATSNIVNGVFSFAVKPGIYKVMIDAVEPYKDVTLENIGVKEGQSVDVGEIVLVKSKAVKE